MFLGLLVSYLVKYAYTLPFWSYITAVFINVILLILKGCYKRKNKRYFSLFSSAGIILQQLNKIFNKSK